MTKQELLDEIAKIPEDEAILAYHITYNCDEGQSTIGGFMTSGDRALLHSASVMKHLADCLKADIRSVTDLAVAYYEWKQAKGQHTERCQSVQIDEKALRAVLGGAHDADQ